MGKLTITRIEIENNLLKVYYKVDEELRPYFSFEKEYFLAEYSVSIEEVPESIAVIPFITNVLPIIWITDSLLEVPELDQTFYHSIPNFKQGYIDMSPMLSFKGEIKVEKLIDNTYQATGGNAAFFSGGVDAFTTLIAHIEEKPTLITLFGSDVKLNDTIGIQNVYNHVEKTVNDFQLPPAQYIKTNFRSFINESKLSELVKASKDGWWHGYQHGIGIIGHAAPIAYLFKFHTIYIASTFTVRDKVICASDPTIDSKVQFGNSFVFHDQYEHNRQEKLQIITHYCNINHQKVEPHVCWISSGGKNCCKCEKCIRTIYGLLAEGVSPKDYGFNYTPRQFRMMPIIMIVNLMNAPQQIRILWEDIQNRFKETQRGKDSLYTQWIHRINVHSEHLLLRKYVHCIYQFYKRMFQ